MGGTNYLRYPKYNSFYKSAEEDVSKKALLFFAVSAILARPHRLREFRGKYTCRGNRENRGQVNVDYHASFLNFVCLSRRPDKQKNNCQFI